MEVTNDEELKLYNSHAAIVRSGDLYTIVLGYHPDKRDFQSDWARAEQEVRHVNGGKADLSLMRDLFAGMRKVGWKMSIPSKSELFL